MFQTEYDVAPLESTPLEHGLWYDPDKIILEGNYTDEVSAYRARRRWIKTFETNFLLEGKHDFKVRVVQNPDQDRFRVRCDFLTACGRYAFWRLTHNQAPEVQYLLETAHLPSVSVLPKQYTSESDMYSDMEPQVFSEGQYTSQRGPLAHVVSKCLRWIRDLRQRKFHN